MKRDWYSWVGGLACALLGAACSSEQAPEPPMPEASATAASPTVETYEGRGVVKSILPNKAFVVIDHEAIPGYMDAMSMPVAVRDSSLLSGLSPEDSIYFTLTVTEGQTYMSRVEAPKWILDFGLRR